MLRFSPLYRVSARCDRSTLNTASLSNSVFQLHSVPRGGRLILAPKQSLVSPTSDQYLLLQISRAELLESVLEEEKSDRHIPVGQHVSVLCMDQYVEKYVVLGLFFGVFFHPAELHF